MEAQVSMRLNFLPCLRDLEGRNPCWAALGLGALSALALPPLYIVPVLFAAIPGLIALLDRASPRQAFRRGFCFAFGHHLLGLYWITEAILFEAARFWWLVPLAVPALSLVLALFVAVPCWLAVRLRPGLGRVFALCALWTLAFIAQQFVLTGFPWNPLGSVWEIPGPLGDLFLQPVAAISIHGLTLLTLLLAATPALGGRAVAVGFMLFALVIGWSADRLAQIVPPPAAKLTVVLVQGNILQGQKSDRAAYVEAFKRHLALTEAGVQQAQNAGGQTVAVWPETASPFMMDADPNARAAVADAAAGPAFVGAIRWDETNHPRNALIAVYGPGPVAGVYDKHHLVPFGEYIPDWLPIPIKLLPGTPLAPGAGPKTLRMPGVPPAGALICYEAIFPGQIVDEADRPDWLVNVTNDSWFGNSTGPRQHLAAVRARAVEEGLPIMRAANSGITAGFDAMGHELGRLDMNEQGVLLVALPGKLPPTLFARYGLILPIGLCLICLGFGLAADRRAGKLR
jgi:apolipoprotein N-acyltransferase